MGRKRPITMSYGSNIEECWLKSDKKHLIPVMHLPSCLLHKQYFKFYPMWLFTIVVEWSGNQRHHKLEWYIIPLDFFSSSPYRKTFLISEDIVHLEGLKNVDLFEKKVRMIYIAQDSYFWFSTEMFFFFLIPGEVPWKSPKGSNRELPRDPCKK